MKVLFAVSNEEISEAIVKRYQKQFKEIISYKNVYYFNAILKEIQKDKTYDRIVISEELEAFTNAQYEQIDRFIFDKLDSISDEATDNKGENTPIILICSDRRNTGENMLVKLFGIGVYDALIGSDRGIDQVCSLINKPRSKKEAKQYYKIEADEVNYQAENENDVSEQEIQNILAHYKKLGKKEDKYVASFDNIVAQYNDAQLRIISKFLPLNVRAVLEEKSPKYQQIMSFNNSVTDSIRKTKNKTENLGPSGKLLKPKNANAMPTEPIIIPNSVSTSGVRKLSRNNTPTNNNGIQNFDNEDIHDFETFMAENGQKDDYVSNDFKNMENNQTDYEMNNNNIDSFIEDSQQFDSFETNNQKENSFETTNKIKKGNQPNDSLENSNQQYDQFGTGNQQYDPFGAGNQQYDPFGAGNQQYDPFGTGNQQYDPFGTRNQQYDPFGAGNQQYDPFGAGNQQYDTFGSDNQQNSDMFENQNQQQYNQIEEEPINKTKTSKKSEEPAPATRRRGRPRKNPIKTEDDNMLPGFESSTNSSSNDDTSFKSDGLLPGFDNDASVNDKYNSSVGSDDNMLPGFSDFINNSNENNQFDNDGFNNNQSNYEFNNNDFGNSQINNDFNNNDFGNSQINNDFNNNDFGNSQINNDFNNNDFGNSQINNDFNNNDFGNNQINNDFNNGFQTNQSNNGFNNNQDINTAFGGNDFNNGYGNSQFNDNQYYNQPNNFGNIPNNQFGNNGGELSRLLTDNKRIVTFVGTSKNGTSFIVNNLAEYASSIGINVAILDTTKNKNSFYIYTKNEEELRQIASKCLEGLVNGQANGISVNRNLTVYTSLPEDREELKSVNAILETLVRVHDLVLIDCDFDTPMEYFANSSETYLIQSYDILTIQPLTAFLRELKAHNMLDQNKLKILLNKNVKVRGITDKTIIGGMSKYNDPAMSFMTDLFDINAVKSMPIQFEQDIYTRYLESVINCDVSIKGYSKAFIQTLRDLCGWVYPSIPGNNSYRPQAPMYSNTTFSANMNNTLNQMKRNY